MPGEFCESYGLWVQCAHVNININDILWHSRLYPSHRWASCIFLFMMVRTLCIMPQFHLNSIRSVFVFEELFNSDNTLLAPEKGLAHLQQHLFAVQVWYIQFINLYVHECFDWFLEKKHEYAFFSWKLKNTEIIINIWRGDIAWLPFQKIVVNVPESYYFYCLKL